MSLDLDALQRAIDGLRAEKLQVERDRAEVCKLKEVVQLNLGNFQHRVKLNVGGSKFETSLSTLQRYPDSMLGTMFSGRDGIVVPVDEQGFVFIDRSGAQFGVVLDFLRTGKVRLPAGAAARAELVDEADFYLLRAHMEGAPGWCCAAADAVAPKSVVICTDLSFERALPQLQHQPVEAGFRFGSAAPPAMSESDKKLKEERDAAAAFVKLVLEDKHEAALNAAMKKEPGLRIVSTTFSTVPVANRCLTTSPFIVVTVLATE